MEKKVDKLSGKDIVLYALYLLGGGQNRIHTEDITLKCYKLAPSKFSWVKYPEYPDVAPARFVLEKLKKDANYGHLVEGKSERKKIKMPRNIKELLDPKDERIGGWMLTNNGSQWIKVNKARIEKYLEKHIPVGDRLPANRKLKELQGSVAFKKFRDYGVRAEISHAEFSESIICTVNTGLEILNDRLEQLYSIADELRKEEVKNYVNFCRKRFASLLGRKVGEKNAKR
jgi:RNase P subunit RPR2